MAVQRIGGVEHVDADGDEGVRPAVDESGGVGVDSGVREGPLVRHVDPVEVYSVDTCVGGALWWYHVITVSMLGSIVECVEVR